MASTVTTLNTGLGIGAPGTTFTVHDETQFTPTSNTLIGVAVIVSNKGSTDPLYMGSVQQVRREYGPVSHDEGFSKIALNSAIQSIPHWVVRVVDPATARVGCLGFNFGTPAASGAGAASTNTSSSPTESAYASQPSFVAADPSQESTLDNFDLVFTGKNPGDWVNGIKVRLTNFVPSTRQFDVVLYPANASGTSFIAPLESYTVTLDNSQNGFWQQQEITQTINNGSQNTSSSYIKVVKGNAANTLDAIFADVAAKQKTNSQANVTFEASFTNGANGNWPTDSQIAEAISQFADPQKYDFWLMATYGFSSDTVRAAVNDVVSQRPDCIGLVDLPSSAQDTSGEGQKESNWMLSSGLTSNRMFAYSSDVYINVPDLANNEYVPPTGVVAKQLGISWNANGLFQAVAWRKRGALPDVLDTRVRYTGAQEGDTVSGGLNTLANNRINPIVPNSNGGFMIGDCLSCQTYTSMLSFQQVVVGLIYIRRLILKIAGDYEFDNITEKEMYRIQRQIQQPLDTLVNQESLQGAQVVCDASNNPEVVAITGKLQIDVYLAFYGFARQIKIDAYLTKDSASFEALQTGGAS